ncbi:hydrolase [Trinickia caryophylli]|uniref:Nicotinamidase-related amidase n=1 Tax=Trinickia caryophylli TaxID=28094 RepID=A0A1X7DXE6_TRICW|nr:hydrolase [Trinickia caryophylli]PMS14173.1 hydrolase [Trinickia caryophylli]TRX17871.1 hydrolase [Trinickia caryophylli]WQE11359.1 hydrolase [Trinickia caryophylli]SMF23579.1 Nicotinamidase-related amidase [Trinickia caryophylli]GLU32517.1 hydrolase [Trinickia caryophylli]
MLQNLDPHTTALVLIDLQQGILGFGKAPRSGEAALTAGAKLAKRFRRIGAPVVLVRVGWSADFGDALKQPVDRPTPMDGGLPANWWDFPAELETSPSDILITKRQWGAFHGTELDLQLRRRGVRTIVLGGVSTNVGVESTARAAFEHGYALVLVEDAMSCVAAEQHRASVEYIFPRLGLVRSSEEVLAALPGPADSRGA